MSAPLPPGETAKHRVETYSALANAAKLASSLVVSFGITLAVRQLFIPQTLGTARFGELNLADGWAGLFLISAWLGVDTWLRKELGVTLKSANGLFAGVFLVRAALATVFTGALAVTLHLRGRNDETVITAVIFGGAQLMMMTQNTASALLHAAGKVGGLSVTNIIGKLIWAVLVVAALWLKLSIIWLAAAFAISEGFKACASTILARVHTGLRFNLDVGVTVLAIRSSVPWWINNLAISGTGRADVAVLDVFAVKMLGDAAAADREIGWYTLIIGLGGMVLVATPVISWVLVPLMSRAVQHSEAEAQNIVRRAIEVCVVAATPISVGAFVAADELIGIYKPEYAPAARVLKIMSWTYVLTYLNVVAANCLSGQGRGWTVTLTSLTTLFLTPLLDMVLVPIGLERLGPSGGATACAISIVFAETLTTAIMLRRLGRMAVDARLVSVALRTLATAGITVGADLALQRLAIHAWARVGLDAVIYLAAALLTRSVRIHEAIAFIKLARSARQSG
jgi:O-antigen/teichoic acid export membrane protein